MSKRNQECGRQGEVLGKWGLFGLVPRQSFEHLSPSYLPSISVDISTHMYACTHTHTTPAILTPCSYAHAQSFDRVQLFTTPWTVAWQSPLSVEFSRQECWSGLPPPTPWVLPWCRDWTHVSCLVKRNLYHWVTWEAPYSLYSPPLLTSTASFPNPSHPH